MTFSTEEVSVPSDDNRRPQRPLSPVPSDDAEQQSCVGHQRATLLNYVTDRYRKECRPGERMKITDIGAGRFRINYLAEDCDGRTGIVTGRITRSLCVRAKQVSMGLIEVGAC